MKNHLNIFLFILAGNVLLLMLPQELLAQRKSKVYVERTKVQRYTSGIDKERLIGDVLLRHENMRFYCDSAYLNSKGNSFEAFGNVYINLNDTIDVYGDRMIYQGNTRIAELFGNVKLIDKETVLTTEHLVYNRNTGIAFYDVGGNIVNMDNTLVSQRGYYNTANEVFYFREDVVLTNPDSETYSDTLIYNTVNETAYFHGPTLIRGKESTIYTEDGWYNTRTDESKLTRKPTISGSEQIISADSILYNNNTSFGKAFGLVKVTDTVHQVIIQGKYGEMWDSQGKSFITDSAVAITYDGQDSMFIHSDTMWMYFDRERQAKKMLAYYHVRFFKENMQGKCDSLAYSMADSTIRLYTDPVLWSGPNQLTADSINIAIVNNEVDSLVMYNTAFIVSRDSTDTYNQIRGKEMIGYFKDNALAKIQVEGNAQTVYYIREEDGYLMGINLSESSSMLIRLLNNQVQNINYQLKAEEVMYPEADMPADMKLLKGFSWQELLRPLNKADIFNINPED